MYIICMALSSDPANLYFEWWNQIVNR